MPRVTPRRIKGLILGNASARFVAAEGYPGAPEPAVALVAKFAGESWGTEALTEFAAPDASRDPAYRHWLAMSMRLSLTPTDAEALFRSELSLDVRHALSSMQAPTLVLHRRELETISVEHARYLSDHISGARLALLPGKDATLYTEPVDEVLELVAGFLGGLEGRAEPDRALAAILFTDIVGSTERASSLGDRQWRRLLETHDAVAHTVVEQHRGRLVKMTGDGILATFDGPGRAIRCALALSDALRPLGVEIRSGLHTGEVEVRDSDIAGIGVHIAARVLDHASAGEVLVSAAVPMLVAGSGFTFEDRGEQDLKGIPDSWRLFAVEA